jgi:hypothetical protein
MSKSLIKDAVHSGSPLKHLVEKALTQLNIPPDEHARAFDMISQALLFFDDEPTGGPIDEYFAEAGSFEAALYEVGKGYGATDADMASFVAVMDTTGDVMIGDVDLADIPEDSDEGNWTAPEVTGEGFPDHRTNDAHWSVQQQPDAPEFRERASVTPGSPGWTEPVFEPDPDSASNAVIDPHGHRTR